MSGSKSASSSGPKSIDGKLGPILDAWEPHREEPLALVQDFTNRNPRMRQPDGSVVGQYVKEWFICSLFKFVGSSSIAGAIYGYDSKVFRQALESRY
jgi:hypothetical protein